MEGPLFPTCKRTVFKLLFEESLKSLHSSTMSTTLRVPTVSLRKVPIAFPVVTCFDIFFSHISFFKLDRRSFAFSLERNKSLIRSFKCFCKNKVGNGIILRIWRVGRNEFVGVVFISTAINSIKPILRRHW